jgi:hypothetical protein
VVWQIHTDEKVTTVNGMKPTVLIPEPRLKRSIMMMTDFRLLILMWKSSGA